MPQEELRWDLPLSFTTLPLKRNLLIGTVLTAIMLFQPIHVARALPLSPVEKSWLKTFVVLPTDGVALRGVLGLANTQVNGSFTVRSCCGFSTNDIEFNIFNVDFSASKDYGAVVGSLSFGWNTGSSEEYEMHFDNGWGQVCKGNVCGPDPSHPSSHNKTIELSIIETAPGLFPTPTLSSVIIGLTRAIAVGIAVSGIVILRERRKRKPKKANSEPL